MSEYVLTYAKILEHLYRQVDSDGNQIHIYDVVVGHSNYKGAIYMADKYYERIGPAPSRRGNLGPCPRPWRGVVTDRLITAICRFRARREWTTSMA